MSTVGSEQRARDAAAFALDLVSQAGAGGALATDVMAAMQTHCGGSRRANQLLLARLVRRGILFAKQGTVQANVWRLRIFSTQAGCDACPVFKPLSGEEYRESRRGYMKERRRMEREANPPAPKVIESPRAAAKAKKAARPDLSGEAIITAKTKVTIAPTPVDYRYYVAPAHRGEFSADWQARRGEAVTC